ncbi:MAG: PorT family protein, partial [Candidatus Edwardsbacteria bacterium]|nr:PorT family protein [Candidatus Edwardsbacteria bacterium]MBU1577071.1 PorT family protein [Candidatus Edwardsbacteria bacterium]
KTKLILLVLVTVMVFSLPQYCSAQGLSLGIKGGLNMANFTGADAGTNSMKTGLVGGAYATIDLMFVNIQPEVLFSQKGATYEVLGLSIDQNLNYVEIPVLIKFPLGKIVVPSIYVGPSFGMLMSADIEGIDVKDAVVSSDLGLVFGVDVKTPIKLTVDARYNLGLQTTAKEYEFLGQTYNPDVKNSTISLMVGYGLF